MDDVTLHLVLVPNGAVRVAVQVWEQDGVWNGIAVTLPVAVFGATYAETSARLRRAIHAHLMLAIELGVWEMPS